MTSLTPEEREELARNRIRAHELLGRARKMSRKSQPGWPMLVGVISSCAIATLIIQMDFNDAQSQALEDVANAFATLAIPALVITLWSTLGGADLMRDSDELVKELRKMVKELDETSASVGD